MFKFLSLVIVISPLSVNVAVIELVLLFISIALSLLKVKLFALIFPIALTSLPLIVVLNEGIVISPLLAVIDKVAVALKSPFIVISPPSLPALIVISLASTLLSLVNKTSPSFALAKLSLPAWIFRLFATSTSPPILISLPAFKSALFELIFPSTNNLSFAFSVRVLLIFNSLVLAIFKFEVVLIVALFASISLIIEIVWLLIVVLFPFRLKLSLFTVKLLSASILALISIVCLLNSSILLFASNIEVLNPPKVLLVSFW